MRTQVGIFLSTFLLDSWASLVWGHHYGPIRFHGDDCVAFCKIVRAALELVLFRLGLGFEGNVET